MSCHEIHRARRDAEEHEISDRVPSVVCHVGSRLKTCGVRKKVGARPRPVRR
jgi:hypothetical protein